MNLINFSLIYLCSFAHYLPKFYGVFSHFCITSSLYEKKKNWVASWHGVVWLYIKEGDHVVSLSLIHTLCHACHKAISGEYEDQTHKQLLVRLAY